MYSHGSRVGVGSGKRGHGGRNYRPPRDKRDPTKVPPPLKECGCLIELHVPEYEQPVVAATTQNQPAAVRQHAIFGGRDNVPKCESFLRSNFCVHLIVPGKKQKGPLGIVGESIQQVLPATEWLMEQFFKAAASTNNNNNNNNNNDEEGARTTTTDSPVTTMIQFKGRVFLDIQKDMHNAIDGTFQSCNSTTTCSSNRLEMLQQPPYWLFQSERWCVLVCNILEKINKNDNNNPTDDNATIETSNNTTKNNGNNNNEKSNGSIVEEKLQLLQTCFDNAKFRLGNNATNQLELFLDVIQEDYNQHKKKGGGRGQRGGRGRGRGRGGSDGRGHEQGGRGAGATPLITSPPPATTRTTAFAVGNPHQAKLLWEEISNAIKAL